MHEVGRVAGGKCKPKACSAHKNGRKGKEDTEPFQPRGARVVAPLARYIHVRLNRGGNSTEKLEIIKSDYTVTTRSSYSYGKSEFCFNSNRHKLRPFCTNHPSQPCSYSQITLCTRENFPVSGKEIVHRRSARTWLSPAWPCGQICGVRISYKTPQHPGRPCGLYLRCPRT